MSGCYGEHEFEPCPDPRYGDDVRCTECGMDYRVWLANRVHECRHVWPDTLEDSTCEVCGLGYAEYVVDREDRPEGEGH